VRTLQLEINTKPLRRASTEIKYENCGGTDWVLTIYELGVMGRIVTYFALKCKGCGMAFPLQELAKNVKKETVVSMLRQ
jgi:hypothetical protein